MNHQFAHPSSLKNNNLIRAPFLSPPTKITQPKTHIDTPVVNHKTMFSASNSLPTGTQDDSVLNNRERLRRQHMNRPNMPSTPTLGKTNHFQENTNPQQQQQQPGQPGTSFTIEIASAPKKGPPMHLLERLSKKTSIAKTVKDSEMGDGNGNVNPQQSTTNNTATSNNQRRQTILEFQKRKSTTLKQTSLLNKPNQTEAPNLKYTTFDTNGLTLDDDLEIGFEKSGSPILSLNGLTRTNQTPTNLDFASQQAQQNVNIQPSNTAQQPGFQFGFNQRANQPNPQWQMEQQMIEQQKLEQQRVEQQQMEQQRVAEHQRAAAEHLLQQQQLEQQRMADQQRLRDQQQQQQLDQLNEQQRAAAEQQMLQQKQMEQHRMLEQQRVEQEKLQHQFSEQQRTIAAEQQRVAAEQQQQLLQQQMWQAQQAQAAQSVQVQAAQMQYIPVYQSVPSEEVQRMVHEVQRQQAEFERQRQAHMEIMQRERAELELGKELLKRQQIELQSKLNEVEQIKMGIVKQPVNERRDSADARRTEVEANRNAKRTVQRQEIIKSKRELNLLNVDKLSRTSREIKREEREEEKKRTRSMLPEGIFSPPRTKPTSRVSLYGSRATPSSAAKSDISNRKPMETPNSLYSPASSMRGSVRSSVSTSKSNNTREMASPSGQLSKRKQMVLEKTRRKAEEFSRKTSNNNTPCQH